MGLIFFKIRIEEDKNLLVSLALIEVIHIQLSYKAFKLGVPEVNREYFGLQKWGVNDFKGLSATIP